jgi:[protein-PII] uridylyltransferase
VDGIRRPRLESVAEGVAVCDDEVVLAPGARPTSDPVLLLRAAAAAAERGVVLAPHTAARLVRQGLRLPQPWPAEAQRHFVSLLGTGNRLRPVWETLDETGALDVLLPEWAGVRLLPHATPVHRYTVDRHLVETCVAAATLTARVERPDLLLVAGLLHDIGKGTAGEHSRTGEPVARGIALRMGFPPADAEVVGRLVRHHLLLPDVATTRDLGDPRVLALVGEAVGDDAGLALLAALTEADARATGEQAWTRWRRGLVGELVAGVRTALRRAATLEGRS